MKVKVSYEFTEKVIPPRCRKARELHYKDEIMVNIREVASDKAPVAFVVKEFEHEVRKVRLYNGRLYKQHQDRRKGYDKLPYEECHPLWVNQTSDMIELHHWEWLLGSTWQTHKSKADNITAICQRGQNLIIIDGEVYERTGEPYYSVTCFGLGGNHGGTGFFVGWADYRDRKSVWGMVASDKDAAINRAVEIALNRGDTESVDYIRRSGNGSIEVILPQAIKRRYSKDY